MKSYMRFYVEVMASTVIALWAQSFQGASAQVAEENRKQLMEALGTPFIVYRDKVLDELKVTDEQREKLLRQALEQVMETGPFLNSLAESGQEREQKLNEHRKNAKEKLAKRLKEVLQPEQLTRLRQVNFQQEGGFALGEEDVQKDLKISQEERQKFKAILRDLQKKVEALTKEAQSGINSDQFVPNLEKLRKEHAKKLEAVLTDDQKKQWKELQGPPFELRE
jgi:hypothetical protein